MITLKTLPDATAQEVFNQIATHLLTQNETCISNQKCLYHHKGLMCAAGCLIAKDEYLPAMDIGSQTWSQLESLNLVPHSPHTYLIIRLQVVHDTTVRISDWKKELKIVANTYKLTMPTIQ